jgi:uncharacterized protein YdeI (BOF family)
MRKGLIFIATSASLLLTPPKLAAVAGDPVPATQAQPQKSQIFVGTIVKRGDTFLFSDNNGRTYRIDDAVDASQLVGKRVRIVGVLDTKKNLIHVESIQQVS